MAEYKILFVDEVDSDIRRFQRYVHKKDTDKKFELITKTPENTLENFLELIKDEMFDAIITDHKLHEENPNIQFDGIELVRSIQEEKEGFPCFIFTSFDDEAVVNGDDVNIVYIKGLMDSDGESKAHATFLDKIENQIKHYRKKIENAEKELLSILEKTKNNDLTAEEEDKLIKLDNFIVSATNKKSLIPEQLKKYQNLEKLHKMIENTDKLLEKLKGLSNE